MFNRRTTVVVCLGLMACDGERAPKGESIRLSWEEGDTFHLAAVYKMPTVMAEENPVNLETADPILNDVFDERWSEEVIWTYQVVDTELIPSTGDELYDYAQTGTGELTSLAVVKVILDPTLNQDPEMLEADPVTYLVFREDNDRLSGVISFTNVDGERVEQAYTTKKTGRSWSVLSQSNLTKVPTFLAPYGTAWEDGQRRTENGRTVSSTMVDDWTVDVVYEDEIDEGVISSRYEAGQPWPTWTVSENMEAWLLNEEEVRTRRGNVPYFLPDDVEEFDFRAALSSSIDLDEALVLDPEMIADEGYEARARDGYLPWAGNWWPLTDGDLVFGSYGGNCTAANDENGCTFSVQIKEEVDVIKKEMDALSAEIRELKDGEEKEQKITEYKEKQQSLVDILLDFYQGLLADLDGGQIQIADGQMSHSADGWSYDLDALSPMDKFATVQYLEGNDYPNPFYLSAWEILNSYNPGGESWWGHCNGWAAAAILTNEPTEDMDYSVAGQTIEFDVADMKGLLTESHYSTYSRFYGERYNGDDEDDVTDLTPAAFQKIISFYVKEQGVPLVFDTTATEAVWNFPAYAVDVILKETTLQAALNLVNVNTATLDQLSELPEVDEARATGIIEYREENGPFQSKEELMEVSGLGSSTFETIEDLITVDPIERTFDASATVTLTTDNVDEQHVDGDEPENFEVTWGYSLVTDQDGVVLSGKWFNNEKHPDFAWVPYSNPHRGTNGGSENPFLVYGNLLDVLGDDIERQ